MATEHQKAVVP